MEYDKLPEGLDFETVMEAAKESMFGLGNPGFCMACGADHDGLEPDARERECYECGKFAVYGAEEILLTHA